MGNRPNILSICTYLRCDRGRGVHKEFLQPMAGLHIASLLDKRKYNISLYHEMWHGSYDTNNIGDYDIVFLTGLQKDFDRMRQLSYFFRQSGAIVVAGGSICTLFPGFAQHFFDAVCVGGVDAVTEFIKDYENNSIKKIYNSPQYKISNYRIDHSFLTKNGINNEVHFIEASRGCNFKCDFCIIPAENAKHATYDIEHVVDAINNSIESTLRLSIKRIYPVIWFLDNNFSNNIGYMKSLCDILGKDKRIKFWGAMITQNVLRDRETIKLMAASKCRVIFSGIESFDLNFLNSHNKKQNVTHNSSVIEDIKFAQKQGILVIYGYLFDPRITSVTKMKEEIKTILDSGTLTYPNYISFIMPLLGTELFWESVKKKDLLPNLLLRDMDGGTLTYNNPIDKFEKITDFAKLLYTKPHLLSSKKKLLRKVLKFIFNSGTKNPIIWYFLYRNNFRPILQAKAYYMTGRNYIGGEDILDPQYYEYPDYISFEDKEKYFDPIKITDQNGNLCKWLESYLPENILSLNEVETENILSL